MGRVKIAPADIIFWMHYAKVKFGVYGRMNIPTNIQTASGCYPDPNAACKSVIIPGHDGYACVMDPFLHNEPECRSIQNMG
jgi:hypothetical protein